MSQGRIQAYLSVNRLLEEVEAAKKLILSRQIMVDNSLLGNESVDLKTLLKQHVRSGKE